MKIYGITGGAGTGKSEVLKLLKEAFNGYVILTDDVARKLTLKGGISYRLIVEHFGAGILGPDEEIDRLKLADIVFHNENELHVLNNLTHPYVRQEVLRQIDEVKKEGKYSFVAVESAILLDAGYEDFIDEFWFVHTDPAIRRQRMIETRGYSDEKVDSIMKNQPADDIFYQKCQFAIENNTTLADVYKQLEIKLKFT